MRFDRPFSVVTSTADGDVLAVLARADRAFTAPEVQAIAQRRSVEGVRRALKRLASEGIVSTSTAAHVTLYALNREHLAAGPLVEIAGLLEQFLTQTRQQIRAWSTPCTYAALFGSAARGGMRSDSDVDLLVVRPASVGQDEIAWVGQLDHLRRSVKGWTGNDPRILEVSESEAAKEILKEASVLQNVRAEGIWLAGGEGYLSEIQRLVE